MARRRRMRMEGWKHFDWFHFCLPTCCNALQCNLTTQQFISFRSIPNQYPLPMSLHILVCFAVTCLSEHWLFVCLLVLFASLPCLSFFLVCLFFLVFFLFRLFLSHLLSLMRKGAASLPTLPSTDFCLVKGGPILHLELSSCMLLFPLFADLIWKLAHCQNNLFKA